MAIKPNYFSSSSPVVVLDERYECNTGGASKYWEIKITDNGTGTNSWYRYRADVKYGKLGTRGMTSLKEFSTAKACNVWASGKIKEKLDKGYILVSQSNAIANMPVIVSATTLSGIKNTVKTTAQYLYDSMAGVEREVIITVIVSGEVIQETIK